MLWWGWGVAGLVVKDENKCEMKKNHVVLPSRRILDNNQQALIISFSYKLNWEEYSCHGPSDEQSLIKTTDNIS
jgi:hypothetical protein